MYKSFRFFGFVCFIASLCIAGRAFAVKESHHTNPDDFSFIEWEGWGGTNGVLTGRVIDKYGIPLSYARIKVHSKDIVTTADKNGYFTIRGLQRGAHYSLVINAKGYNTEIARWIPIPINSTADIGDYHLNEEELWTNMWVIITNSLYNGSAEISSNMLEIAGPYTTTYSYAQWQQLTDRADSALEERVRPFFGVVTNRIENEISGTLSSTGSVTNVTKTEYESASEPPQPSQTQKVR